MHEHIGATTSYGCSFNASNQPCISTAKQKYWGSTRAPQCQHRRHANTGLVAEEVISGHGDQFGAATIPTTEFEQRTPADSSRWQRIRPAVPFPTLHYLRKSASSASFYKTNGSYLAPLKTTVAILQLVEPTFSKELFWVESARARKAGQRVEV